MTNPLTFEEARVLGCLIEKEMSTPDYYPLTPSALVAACNQLSNRDPVVEWDTATVEAAATGLRQRSLAAMLHMAGSRVPKFKHLADEYFPTLGAAERALLSVLILRGPQTPAELRARTERLHHFPDQEAVESSLAKLMDSGDGALVVHMPPGGGRRVSTYAHLLCGAPTHGTQVATATTIIPPAPDRLAAMQDEIDSLRADLADLRTRLTTLESNLGGP